MGITVNDLMDLLDACDHDIVIYDENVIDEAAENYGDMLYSSESGRKIPGDVLALDVVSFDLEDNIFRIWAYGEGIPRKYPYGGIEM
jgi:hypothetical protein